MRVGLLDVGSNTVRLLVADVHGDAVVPVDRAKAYLRLGAEIERRGRIRSRKIAETAGVAAELSARAEGRGIERAGVLVTAPGRQTREPAALVTSLAGATGWPVRILSHSEEGGLAFAGAVASARLELPDVVGVVDVGGGSTEIAVGTPMLGAAWVHSLDLGSLRLTRRLLTGDPVRPEQVAHARDVVARAIREARGPRPDVLLAVGGSARALARTLGGRFDAGAVDEVVAACAGRSSTRIARALAIDGERSTTIVGGALLLAAVSRLLGRELVVTRGGLREGAALSLAHAPAAAHAA